MTRIEPYPLRSGTIDKIDDAIDRIKNLRADIGRELEVRARELDALRVQSAAGDYATNRLAEIFVAYGVTAANVYGLLDLVEECVQTCWRHRVGPFASQPASPATDAPEGAPHHNDQESP